MYHNALPNSVFDLKVNTSGNIRVISRCYRPMGYFNRSASTTPADWKYTSCYTGAMARLLPRDVVSIQNMYRGSLVSTIPQHTFIGFIKLSSGR